MSYEPNAHPAQVAILRHLLFKPQSGFAELQRSTSLTSDHFNFHVKKLIEEEYVGKIDKHYKLTVKGKEYANRMDTDENEIEKQPKVSIAITLERKNWQGEREFLFQQRKKNPYYDFWGRVGGKMRWGETVIEAANRELKEETGLEAKFEYKLLYHKRDFDKQSGELLEDKIFLCVHATEFSGELIEEFEGGINRWMTDDEFHKRPKRFVSVDDFVRLIDEGVTFAEREFYYDESEY
ncbi:MAG TPA: NUDIX domain-containing protein [Candidatus Saccharimonadales bacterium]|jgi:ADP-ribose pyrophosphatase YjhB (NUDIX family)|nr:NUDIX domain-containing protein [Candidatus Saccharimonadales bacterium]